MITIAQRVNKLLKSAAPANSVGHHHAGIDREYLSWRNTQGVVMEFRSQNWNNNHGYGFNDIEQMMMKNRARFPDLYKDV